MIYLFKDYHKPIEKALDRQFSILIINILLAISSYTYCQSSLLINNFEKSDYRADNQNWSISISKENLILFGNNKGLLYFDGATWKTKLLPENTTIRSVLACKDRVYIGSFENFGYFEVSNRTLGNYVPLSSPYKSKIHNEEFWRIIALDDIVFFQSFGTLFYLSKNRIGKVPLDFSILLLMQAGENIFT